MRTTEQAVRLPFGLLAVVWVVRRLFRLMVLILTTPAALGAVAGYVGLNWLSNHVSPWATIAVLIVLVIGLVVLRVRRPAVFARRVSLPALGWARSWLVYRARWSAAMTAARLTSRWRGVDYAPTIRRVRSTGAVDRVRVRMLPGQTVEDYTEQAPGLAQTFGAQVCRVHSVAGRVHEVDLWLLTRDPLTAVVQPLPPAGVLADGLAVARVEDGSLWRLQLVGSHVLVVGATGSGKGSVIWSMLVQLVPHIRAGLVEVWAFDPKGGMELAGGAPLFARFVHGDSEDPTGYEATFADQLEAAVQVMRRRQDRLRGRTRLHEPVSGDPLIVLVLDELAALTGWVTDRTAKKRIESALGLLLSQGRAVGVVVVGCVQDPRKDVLPMRDLFPTRICLRVAEAEHVTLALGPGARNRGAHADLIPDSTPGVGYVAVDGIAEPVRVRFSRISDETIAQLTRPATPGATIGDPPATRPALTLVDDDRSESVA